MRLFKGSNVTFRKGRIYTLNQYKVDKEGPTTTKHTGTACDCAQLVHLKFRYNHHLSELPNEAYINSVRVNAITMLTFPQPHIYLP